jgi:hypothetical protein
MYLIEVKTPEQEILFLNLPNIIYKNDSNWIKPLDQDIRKVFDTNKNKLYTKGGKTIRYNLFNNENEHIGRIAAFISPKYENSKVGGFGFFECINNQNAANLLLDEAKLWISQQGIDTMDGPINFGERDQWWGLLIQGFNEPLYGMNYNPQYYVKLFENYGLKTYYNQECFALNLKDKFKDKFYIQHQEIKNLGGYKAEHFQKKYLKKYAADFHEIYNKAWATHDDGKQLTLQQAENIFKSMKAVVEEKIVWFVYKDGKPIAFWLNLPDLNQYFKHLNGKFNLIYKLYFLVLQKFIKNKRIIGIVFGVIPEYHGTGVDSFMIIEGCKVIHNQLGYENYEMQWIGDFNPKMIKVAENLGSHISRRLRTYRIHFDNRPVELHKKIGLK